MGNHLRWHIRRFRRGFVARACQQGREDRKQQDENVGLQPTPEKIIHKLTSLGDAKSFTFRVSEDYTTD